MKILQKVVHKGLAETWQWLSACCCIEGVISCPWKCYNYGFSGSLV